MMMDWSIVPIVVTIVPHARDKKRPFQNGCDLFLKQSAVAI